VALTPSREFGLVLSDKLGFFWGVAAIWEWARYFGGESDII
jgi:hypothetical protein